MSVASKTGRFATRTTKRAASRTGRTGWSMTRATTLGCLYGWLDDLPRKVNPDPSMESPWERRAQFMSSCFWPSFAAWLSAGAPSLPNVPQASGWPGLATWLFGLVPLLLNWITTVARLTDAPAAVIAVVTLFATVVLMRRIMAAAGHGWRLNALAKASRRWLAFHKWLCAPLAVGAVLLPLWWLVGPALVDLLGVDWRTSPGGALGFAIPTATLLAVGAFIASREVKWRKKIAAKAPTLAATLKISEDAVIRECTFMPRKGEPFFDLVDFPPTVKEHIKGLRERVATHLEDAEAHVHENDLLGVTSISFKPVSDKEKARREWVRKTDGLIQSVTLTDVGAIAELGSDVKDSAAQTVERHLAEAGFGVLVEFDSNGHMARAERLDHVTLTIRNRLANELGFSEKESHKVELSVREVVDAHTGERRIDEIVVLRHPHEARAESARRFAWQDFILELHDGSRGWLIEDQPATATSPATVTLTWGKKPALPKVVPMSTMPPYDKEGVMWNRIPLGFDAMGVVRYIDLELGPHACIAGPVGSGKSVYLRQHAYAALVMGHDVIFCDGQKDCLDFQSFFPWAVAVADGGIESVRAVIEMVYEEGVRRKAIQKEYGAPSFRDLPADVREAKRIRPITVIFDEFTAAVVQVPVPKGIDKDSPDYAENVQKPMTLNAHKGVILNKTASIARELRYNGIFLAAAGQRWDGSLLGPGGTELRSNMTSRTQLVKPGSPPARETLGMVFSGERIIEVANAIEQFDNGRDRGLAVMEADGGDVVALRVAFGTPEEIPALLEARGVPKPPKWKVPGRPDPEPAPFTLIEPTRRPTSEAPNAVATSQVEVIDIGELEFSLDELEIETEPDDEDPFA